MRRKTRPWGVTLGDMEITLAEKKRAAKSLFRSLEEQRQRLLAFVAEENDLLQEIEFYESEKNDVEKIQSDISSKYAANLSVLEGMIKNVGFLKGEIGHADVADGHA